MKRDWELWRQFFEVIFQGVFLMAQSLECLAVLRFEPRKVCAISCFFTGIVKLRLSPTYVWCHSDS